MANAFGKSLLAYAVAFAVGGTVLAQDPFQDGVKLLRLGQKQEALAKFQEALKADPSNEEALQLYRSVNQDVWMMLLAEKGEIQQIAASILQRAKVQQQQLSRDEAAIESLVAVACAADSSYDQRREAVLKLISDHGEFAVPSLLKRLADADDAAGQVNAIYALYEIGRPAVLPLLAALHSSDGLVRQNAAAALHQIGDPRAAPAMAALAQFDDLENVREVARRFLKKNGIQGKAVDLYLAQGRSYLRNGVTQGAFSSVVWSMVDDKLVAHDVPALLYPFDLAKACGHEAVAIDPLSAEARSLVAQANLGEAQLIRSSLAANPDDQELQAIAPLAGEFELAAMATGSDTLRSALSEALSAGLTEVAIGAVEALGRCEDRDSIAQSSLLAALDCTDKRVSYAAAMAVARVAGGANVPESSKVVALLAQAVQEESLRQIQVIGGGQDWKVAVNECSGIRGNAAVQEATAAGGIDAVFRNPDTDVVVLNEILPDALPEQVIGNIRNDPRLQHVKILVVAKDPEAARARFSDSVTDVIQGPLTGESLVSAINSALEGVPIEPRNARAEMVAKQASEALLRLSEGRADIGGALVSLAAQLNRADAIAIPAARALSFSGGTAQLDPLLQAVTGGGSDDLKCAAAYAIGSILARTGESPAKIVEGLSAVVHSDQSIAVRTAAATALGRAHLADGDKARLIDSLRKIATKVEG
ncbi:MAG: hypothetical protein Fur0037_16810 [Planctomycetota bacterium]